MAETATKTQTKKNPMQEIRIEKITLNIGAGAEPARVEKGVKLLSTISGMKAVEARAKKRIATWKIRPGLGIGARVTIRRNTEDLLKRLLKANDMIISSRKFNENGFSFGINEYINIPEVKYDPKIGIIGLNVSVTLKRPGFRVKKRKLAPAKISSSHRITKENAIEFVEKLGAKVE
jgi:large subunit ribosomal protein L5|tara:strand:+ start:223 stop:753 length:531 start_codon:yes stop_codon:yes gene_type:complete